MELKVLNSDFQGRGSDGASILFVQEDGRNGIVGRGSHGASPLLFRAEEGAKIEVPKGHRSSSRHRWKSVRRK